MLIYDGLNFPVIKEVPTEVNSILDLGCGSGRMGAFFKENHSCNVTGVTFSQEEANIARGQIDRVEVENLNSFDPAKLGKFDCVVCSHVLEHLFQPEELLCRVRGCLHPDGVLIVALPNILFWQQRVQFLTGRWRYTDGWLMDRTHFRFFDWESAAEMLTDAGFRIDHAFADGGIPYTRFLGKTLSGSLDRFGLSLAPGLFGWQFIFRCRLIENGSHR